MIATQDIAQEIYNATQRLDKVPERLFELAEAYAKAQQDYDRELGKEKMRLKDEGLAPKNVKSCGLVLLTIVIITLFVLLS